MPRRGVKRKVRRSPAPETEPAPKVIKPASETEDSSSDSDDTADWEEIITPDPESLPKTNIPEEGLVITVPTNGSFQKKRKTLDPNDLLRQSLNRKMRQYQAYLHKVCLLCNIARGKLINDVLRKDELKAIALSVIPPDLISRRKDLDWFTKVFKWYRYNFRFKDAELSEDVIDLQRILTEALTNQRVGSAVVRCLVFIVIMRALGFNCRFVLSIQPLPLKPKSEDLIKKPKEESSSQSSSSNDNKTKTKVSSKPSSSKKVEKNKGRKIVSSDEESGPVSILKSRGEDTWIEICADDQWIAVDLTSGDIGSENTLEKRATQPVTYVLGFDQQGKIKDVTRRYASSWLNFTQKLRVDSDWWSETLEPYLGVETEIDKDEDVYLDNILANQPIPKSISECKGHALYAMKRHLRKYETIYPPDAPTLGFIKGEAIYPISYVKVLHTREMWLREGKVVRIGESPYKTVKSRTRPDKVSFSGDSGEKLSELFGEWQVENYIPPVASNGIVPRNDYGNVELFKPSMLPQGTVHLNLPGLQRVAKKLNIDCAPALTGFEYRKGFAHPVCEGFVVCEEFHELLYDAWSQEQDELLRKKREKASLRARANWKKLFKFVFTKIRLDKKYRGNTDGSSKRMISTPKKGRKNLT